MIDYYEPNIDLTLLGCGFIGPYHIGAICLLSQIWPQKPYNRICGSSCGGLIGSAIVGGNHLESVISGWVNIITQMRSSLKSPTQIIALSDIIEQNLEKQLTPNAHKNCSGRLGISLTKYSTFENELVSEFNSRKELIDASVCGCFIPLWSGSLTIPTFRGQKYIDGGFSDNQPKFDFTPEQEFAGARRLEISAFSGEVEISPKDEYWIFSARAFGAIYHMNWENFGVRGRHSLFPHKPSTYRCYLINGHRDMKEFILKSDLVKCFDCYQNQLRQRQKQQHQSVISEPPVTIRKSCLHCLKLFERIDSLEVLQNLLEKMCD